MKLTILAALLLHSGLSMAGYLCHSEDSNIYVTVFNDSKVQATYMKKSRSPNAHIQFTGTKTEGYDRGYYQNEIFKLQSGDTVAELTVHTELDWSQGPSPRVPACRFRSCLKSTQSHSRNKITASLEMNGGLTYYTCQKN